MRDDETPDTSRGRLAWEIEELKRWRQDVDKLLSNHEAELNGLVNAQKIAAGVARELQKRGVTGEGIAAEVEKRGGVSQAVVLTWWQKLGGAIVGAIVIIDALRGLIS